MAWEVNVNVRTFSDSDRRSGDHLRAPPEPAQEAARVVVEGLFRISDRAGHRATPVARNRSSDEERTTLRSRSGKPAGKVSRNVLTISAARGELWPLSVASIQRLGKKM